jgi:hypothetical protein
VLIIVINPPYFVLPALPHHLWGTTAGAISLNVYGESGHFTAGFVGANKPAGFFFQSQTCRS